MDLGTNWVAGRWMPATGDAAVIVSPIDGEPLHDVRFAGDREVEAALAAATEAAAAMAATSQAQRARALSDLAAALKRRAEPIAEATILANGCPRKQALAMQALSAVALLEAFAPLAETHALRGLRRGLRGGDVLVRKIPVGVSVGVAPWNAPVFLSAVKLAGAIAAGAPLILKPSPETVGATAWLAEALAELDLPAGALSVLHGGREVGRKLVADPRVAKVSFTGGTLGGLEVAATCARRLARCTLIVSPNRIVAPGGQCSVRKISNTKDGATLDLYCNNSIGFAHLTVRMKILSDTEMLYRSGTSTSLERPYDKCSL